MPTKCRTPIKTTPSLSRSLAMAISFSATPRHSRPISPGRLKIASPPLSTRPFPARATLVLILILIVIAPLVPKGLDTLVPQPSPNQQQNVELENKTVVVHIAMNGKLKINNEDPTWEGLGPRMETIFKERAEKIAFVKGD